MGTLRALVLLCGATLLRVLREGLVLRALVWPGLVTAGAIALSAGGLSAFNSTTRVAVQDPVLAEALRDEGLSVVEVEDPQQAVLSGEVDRAAWEEDGTWVLGTSVGGRATLRAEAVLREHAGASWRIEVPPLAGRSRALEPMTRALVGLLAVLFVLYGVVFGAGAWKRDLEDGSLETERSLPVPGWVHPAARLLGAGLALLAGLALCVGLLHAIIGVDRPLAWLHAGGVGVFVATAVGLGAMAGGASSFSAPLARGSALCMGLLGLGWALPELGRQLPLAAMGALVHGQDPGLGGLPLGLLLAAGVCWWLR